MSVSVIGMGLTTPLGNTPTDVQHKLYDKETGYSLLCGERWSELEKFRTKAGSEIKGSYFEEVCSEIPQEGLERCDLFAAFAVKRALQDAGIFPIPADLRVGLICGTNFGNAESFKRLLLTDYDSEDFLKHVNSFKFSGLSSALAERFSITGPAASLSLSCASGVSTIAQAKRWLENLPLDAVVAVSVDELNMYIFSGLHSLRAMSSENVLRPWDKNRKGTIFGEGAGCIILMKEEKVRELNIIPKARILSTYQNNDGFHLSAPDTSAHGISELMSKTIELGGLTPDDIDFINLHGTGTKYNDEIETKAIKQVFSDRSVVIPVTSNKGALGHLMGAAGMVETISAVVSLIEQKIPPTANLIEQDPALDLRIATEPLNCKIDHAISNSFGFGGANACILLERVWHNEV